MDELSTLLEKSAARHSHLCPRQVLGVRAGLAGLSLLRFTSPPLDKQLLVIIETDGCFADGIEVACGVTVGHRTLRVEDYGKIAATFIHTITGEAYRLAPRLDVRQKAWEYAPEESKHYFAQLRAYQDMPYPSLFNIAQVELTIPIERIISTPIFRTVCDFCGEEIINERDMSRNGFTVCRSCSGPSYYQKKLDEQSDFLSLLTSSANRQTSSQSDHSLS